MAKGWRFESQRHSLARRGIKTAQKMPSGMMHNSNKNSSKKIKRDVIFHADNVYGVGDPKTLDSTIVMEKDVEKFLTKDQIEKLKSNKGKVITFEIEI